MAIRQTRVSCTIIDELNVEARVALYFLADDTAALADLYTDAYAALQAIQPLTGGIITSWTMSIYGDATSFAGTPVVGARVEQTGVFNFIPSGYAGRKFAIPIPAIVNSVLVAGKVDLTNTLIVNLKSEITNTSTPFTPADAHFTSLYGGSLSDAYFSFRKRRKQLTRSTFER